LFVEICTPEEGADVDLNAELKCSKAVKKIIKNSLCMSPQVMASRVAAGDLYAVSRVFDVCMVGEE